MIAMKFTIDLDTRLPFLLKAVVGGPSDRTAIAGAAQRSLMLPRSAFSAGGAGAPAE